MQLRGYRASERLTVRTGDGDTVGRWLGDSVARVEGHRWGVSAGHPARVELRRVAQDARTRADALAAELGGRLGPLVEAVESAGVRPEPRMLATRAAADAPPIAIGEATVFATVSVAYQVKEA